MVSGKNATVKHGAISVYDFGAVRLHAYRTDDAITNEVFIVEKDGKAVVLELPCFRNNIEALSEYVKDNGLKVEAKIVAYHAAGASFLPDVPVYGTKSSDAYNTTGGGKDLVTGFSGAFGDSFDAGIPKVDRFLSEGKNIIAGMEFDVIPNSDAFEIIIPEINAVYMHMLGHDSHSIVAGAGHADALIANIKGYLNKGIDMILTSHYTPEGQKDARDKMAYLEDLKVIASGCKDKNEFKAKVSEKYKGYSGGNYLDMTAGFFFA